MDVFSRLAGRAAGDVPVLRPRPLSRFATAPLPAGVVLAGDRADVSWEARGEAGHEGRAADLADVSAADLANVSAAQSGVPLVDRRVAPVTESQRAHAAPLVDAARPVTAARVRADTTGAAHLFAVTPPEDVRAGADSRTDALAQQPAQRPVAMHPRPAPPLREASPEPTERAPADPATSRRAARQFADLQPTPLLRRPTVAPTDVAAASAAVADARPAAAPLLKTSMPAAAAVLSQAAQHVQTPGVTPAPASGQPAPHAAQAAPVIEITIGRVEVRAVRSPSTAQSPSPARAPQPPRLSLDEYMRPRPGSAG